MDEDVVFALVLFLLALIPVGGLVLRFAVKPLLDSIARLIEVRAMSTSADRLDERLSAVERELREVRADQRRLLERVGATVSLPTAEP